MRGLRLKATQGRGVTAAVPSPTAGNLVRGQGPARSPFVPFHDQAPGSEGSWGQADPASTILR